MIVQVDSLDFDCQYEDLILCIDYKKIMPSVVMVAPVHKYNDVRVFTKMSCSLSDEGWDVTLICGAECPATIKGVKIIPAANWGGGRFKRFLLSPLVILQVINTKADLYHLNNPDTIPLAFVLYLLRRKIIYDTHENFSLRILTRHWIPHGLRRFFSTLVFFLELILAKYIADGYIVTQREQILEDVSSQIIVENYPVINPILEAIPPNLLRLVDNSSSRVIYFGIISAGRGIENCLKAIELLNSQADLYSSGYKLLLVGKAQSEYLNFLSSHSYWKHCIFLGEIPQAVGFSLIKICKAGLCLIEDVGDHRYTSPNKLFEYVNLGVPFVASRFHRWEEIFRLRELGIFVNQDDPSAIANAIDQISNSIYFNSIEFENERIKFMNTNNWSNEFAKVSNLYRMILNKIERL